MEKMTMSRLLAVLRQDGPDDIDTASRRSEFVLRSDRSPTRLKRRAGSGHSTDVYYLQSQNGNLGGSAGTQQDIATSELGPLALDVPREVPWASEALDQAPDAVNL